jgi:tetratricopeptide (TPR) repeat protein
VRRVDGQADQTRFGMLETMREYAAERLEESGEADAVRARHAAHVLALTEEAAPWLMGAQAGTWLNRLELESDNLRAALRWLAERGTTDEGLRIAISAFQLWFLRGHFAEGRAQLGRFLSAEDPREPTALRARGLSLAGLLALRQGDYRAARALAEEELAVARAAGDGPTLASALMDLGRLLAEQGEEAQGQALLAESVAVARAVGDPAELAVSLHWLSQSHRLRGDHAEARRLQEEGLAISLGDTWRAASFRSHLGLIAAGPPTARSPSGS